MSDPDEAFFALFGEEATEAQRRRILEVQEALGLRRSDSLWSVFLALGYFQQIYETMPEKIHQAVNDAIEAFKRGVRVGTKEAHQRAIQDLNQSVQEFLPTLVAEVAGREKWKWATWLVLAVSVLVVIFVSSHALLGHLAYENGFRTGSTVNPEMVAWASSPGGIRARYLDRQGLLDRVDWEGINWNFTFDGAQYYAMVKQGILKRTDDEHLRWVAGPKGKLALAIDDVGLLDSYTLEKLTWLDSTEGQPVYWWIRNGRNRDVSSFLEFAKCVKERGTEACRSR